MHRKHPQPRHRGLTRLLTLAAAGIAAAAYVRHKTSEAELRHPPTGGFVTVEGVRLHYTEAGSGPPLVLLHGNSMMGQDFLLSDLVRLAARKYRVIVIDRPGYGYSTRPRPESWGPEAQARVIHAALRRIGVDRALVLGHSWGAMAAAALALDYPQMVRGLVLEAGYFYPRPRLEMLMRIPEALPMLGDLTRRTFVPILHRLAWPLLAKVLFAPAKVPPHFWKLPPWMLIRPEPLRAASTEMAGIMLAAARLAPRYPALDLPVVIIAGRDEAFISTEKHSVRLAQELPDVELRLFEGVGHMVHHLIPEEVMAAIHAADR